MRLGNASGAPVHADVTLDATAHEPWCLSVPASQTISRGYLVVEGECHLRIGAGDEVTLRAGDFVFLPNGEAHLIGSALDVPARPLSSVLRRPPHCSAARGHSRDSR